MGDVKTGMKNIVFVLMLRGLLRDAQTGKKDLCPPILVVQERVPLDH